MANIDTTMRRNPKPRPESPTFYTARSTYNDQVVSLERSIQYSRSMLRMLHLLPLPAFARSSLPPARFDWKPKPEMEAYMQSTFSMAAYRRVLALLNDLNECKRIAESAGCEKLAGMMTEILMIFTRDTRDRAAKRKAVKVDEHGRTYTVGRRKTSAARVWIIPAKPPTTTPAPEREETLENFLGLPTLTPPTPPMINVTPSTVLINNLPLSSYFSLPADREKVVRPLKLAGVLGGYNVFALVRGGGTTGQSGAVAHGIAKGLAVHEPRMREVLRKCTLPIHFCFGSFIEVFLLLSYSQIIETRPAYGRAEENWFSESAEACTSFSVSLPSSHHSLLHSMHGSDGSHKTITTDHQPSHHHITITTHLHYYHEYFKPTACQSGDICIREKQISGIIINQISHKTQDDMYKVLCMRGGTWSVTDH